MHIKIEHTTINSFEKKIHTPSFLAFVVCASLSTKEGWSFMLLTYSATIKK